MIVYVDTSALVPLLVSEPTSATCGEIWDNADDVTSTRLTYVEAVAALTMAERMSRITTTMVADARTLLDDLWTEVNVVELDEALMIEAAGLAAAHGLRGYDATHCAAGVSANDENLVAASGDEKLLAAWQSEGIAVLNTNS